MLNEQSAPLDKAALAYCKMGMAQYDAAIVAYKAIYKYHLLRPITYIRNVMGYTTWVLPYGTAGAPTPGWPDPGTTDFSASAAVLSSLFGKSYRLNTEGTHPARSQSYTFNSFEEAAAHGAEAGFYRGTITKPAIAVGLGIGYKTVEYMDKKIRFAK